jgi:hypothetical protein
MNWKINVVAMFIFTLLSLLFSFLNMFISAFILIIFYLIDLLKPPFYSADEMEKPIFFTPILVIGVTIYILLKLYLNDLILFILLLTLFMIDMTLSYKRAKD